MDGAREKKAENEINAYKTLARGRNKKEEKIDTVRKKIQKIIKKSHRWETNVRDSWRNKPKIKKK